MDRLPVAYQDIESAAQQLQGKALRTPLLENRFLNAKTGGRILIKPENLQNTGSFKFRGAYNRISRISAQDRPRGILAYSSGNHAQGVALAAQMMGIQATIIMPADAPAIKMRNTRSYGADVITYDRYSEDREAVARKITNERGAILVPPYDDPYIIAGQGTCGLEIAQQAAELDVDLDEVLICCGGGGLSSGSALAIKHHMPDTEVAIVEPQGFDDTARSLKSGTPVANEAGQRSICDALLSATPGDLTLSIMLKHVSRSYQVSDDEVRAAMAFAFDRLKLVVEPGGAVCLAAVLTGKLPLRGRTIALTLSGGNVDPDTFRQAIC